MSSQRKVNIKKVRRSVLQSARRNSNNVDESNNYQLADALAKTKNDLAKVYKEKFSVISENLKLMEKITILKDDKRKLNDQLDAKNNELDKLKTSITKHKKTISLLNKSFNEVDLLSNGKVPVFSTTELTPQSQEGSFDSGLNNSSLDSGSLLKSLTPDSVILSDVLQSPPCVALTDLSPTKLRSTPSPMFPGAVCKTSAAKKGKDLPEVCTGTISSDKESSETPRGCQELKQNRFNNIQQRGKDIKESKSTNDPHKTPHLTTITGKFTNRRETPSRSAKAAIKSMTEPRLGCKLRQGDPTADPFFLNTSRPKAGFN